MPEINCNCVLDLQHPNLFPKVSSVNQPCGSLGTFVLNSIIPTMFTKTLLTYTEAKQFHKNKACTLADIFHTKKLKISTQETNKSWFKALPFFGLL